MKQIELKDTTPGTIVADSKHDSVKFEVMSVKEDTIRLKYISGYDIYNPSSDDGLYPFSSDCKFYISED